MKYRVVVHPRVPEALTDIAEWWSENRSVQQAERWYDGCSKAILDLGVEPHRYPLAAENDEFPYEMRELHYGLSGRTTHRVLFTIRPDMVYVFMLRHVAQRPVSPEDL